MSLTSTLPRRSGGVAGTFRADAWATRRRLALALLALAVLLGFSLPTLLARAAAVDNDAALYLSLALDAYQGHGFTFDGAQQQPLLFGWRWFPLLFVPAWKLLGVSLAAAVWANKLALLGCAGSLMWLGWQLFGPATAIAATALLLASPLPGGLTLQLESDLLQTAFALAFLAAFQRAAGGGRWGWFLVAGLSLALAQRVRESALIWLPVPLLLPALLSGWRTRRTYLGAAAVLAVFALVVSPKLAYDAFAGVSWIDALGAANQARLLVPLALAPLAALACAFAAPLVPARGRMAATVTALAALAALLAAVAATAGMLALFGLGHLPTAREVGEQLGQYWDDRMGRTLPLWPLLVAAWLVVGAQALRGSRPQRFLVLAALASLPIVVATALVHWSTRYGLPFHALSYLALGAVLVSFGRRLSSWRGAVAVPWGEGLAVAVAVALGLGMLLTKQEDQGGGDLLAYNDLGVRASTWLTEHAPPGTPVVAHYRVSSWLRFNTQARFPVLPMATLHPLSAAAIAEQSSQGRPWLNVAAYQDGGVAPSYAALGQDILLDSLRQAGARYLVLTDGYGPSTLAFAAALQPPGFEEVFRSTTRVRGGRQTVVIYAVTPDALQPSPFPVTMTPGTLERLASDLGSAPGSALYAIVRSGVRLDLKDGTTRDLTSGGDPDDPGAVGGWLTARRGG